MDPTFHIWRTESNSGKQLAASVAAVVVGAALAIGFRQFEGPELTGSLAGFLLGLLLLAIGLGALLFAGKQIITVDTKTRRILIEKINHFGRSAKTIRFDEIVDAYVGELGDREGGRISYHVVVKLRTGKEVALFKGFFDGSHNKPAMEARCQRLLQCLQPDALAGC
jgi:hypothetical protein